MRSYPPPQRMVLGDLDDGDLEAVGVGDPHLPQSPGFVARRSLDADAGRLQLGVGGVDVADLEPQSQRLGRTLAARRAAADLEQPAADEEHDAADPALAELAVDPQREGVAVER